MKVGTWEGKTVVTVLPDNAYRYFSTDLFKDLQHRRIKIVAFAFGVNYALKYRDVGCHVY